MSFIYLAIKPKLRSSWRCRNVQRYTVQFQLGGFWKQRRCFIIETFRLPIQDGIWCLLSKLRSTAPLGRLTVLFILTLGWNLTCSFFGHAWSNRVFVSSVVYNHHAESFHNRIVHRWCVTVLHTCSPCIALSWFSTLNFFHCGLSLSEEETFPFFQLVWTSL